MVGILLFAVAFALLMLGFPVAFTFAAVAVGFAVATGQVELFAMMPERIYALMTNVTLMSVPLFVFMGMVLQRSGWRRCSWRRSACSLGGCVGDCHRGCVGGGDSGGFDRHCRGNGGLDEPHCAAGHAQARL